LLAVAVEHTIQVHLQLELLLVAQAALEICLQVVQVQL
jgi:hypothetical protein